MAKITLSDECRPFDGTYDFKFNDPPFTNGDLHIIKKVAAVRASEIPDALLTGDTDLYVALAVIVLCRSGKADRRQALQVAEVLWDSPAGSLKFDFTEDEESDARPPEPTPTAVVSE